MAFEDLVRPDIYEYVEVPALSAALAHFALAGDAQPHPVLDAGRDLHGYLPVDDYSSAAPAFRAGLGDSGAFAAAFVALAALVAVPANTA